MTSVRSISVGVREALGSHRDWLFAAGVVLLCCGIEVHALADRRAGEPHNDGIRRYIVGEIAESLRVSQTFLVKEDGLTSVTVHPREVTQKASGTATLELQDVSSSQGDEVVIARVTEPLSSLVTSDVFTLRFSPQPSEHRFYRVELSVSDVPEGRGLGLLATRGQTYRGESLSINGHPRWGALIFETSVENASSPFAALRSRLTNVGVPVAGFVLLLIFALKYSALLVIIRTVARQAWDGYSRTPAPASSQ